MAVVTRSSLSITRSDLERADVSTIAQASETHYANLAEHTMLQLLPLYEAGHCGLGAYLASVELYACEAGEAGGRVRTEAAARASSITPRAPGRGRPPKHPPGIVFFVWHLVDFCERNRGATTYSRDEIAPAFAAAAAELNRLGLGPFTAGEIKGIWDRESKKQRHKTAG